ncbi:MAG: CBS domain-containing protein [Nitrospira sp.]|jgi:CBS domain-containing protein|nr:CBS domain-containing protein [Nitrospira sp.]
MVTVGQLMKKELITVDAGTSVIDAAKLMKTCNVCSVLIAEKGRIIGIVTESDIVKKVIGSDRGPYFIPVEDIMSAPIVGIEERSPLTEAADLMNKHRTRHLGVVKSGSIIGILSVRDLLQPVSVDEF